jgi:hypothetical protein
MTNLEEIDEGYSPLLKNIKPSLFLHAQVKRDFDDRYLPLLVEL